MKTTAAVDDPRITSFGRLVEAHALLAHRLGLELEAALGLPLLWYGVLLHLGRGPQGRRPISDLVNATAFTSGGVTRLVDRMEQAGYVSRLPCPSDRRVTYVCLTNAGCNLLQQATAVHVEGIQEHMAEPLGAEGLASLDALLARLLDTAATRLEP